MLSRHKQRRPPLRKRLLFCYVTFMPTNTRPAKAQSCILRHVTLTLILATLCRKKHGEQNYSYYFSRCRRMGIFSLLDSVFFAPDLRKLATKMCGGFFLRHACVFSSQLCYLSDLQRDCIFRPWLGFRQFRRR